jgi:hypothetical protein
MLKKGRRRIHGRICSRHNILWSIAGQTIEDRAIISPVLDNIADKSDIRR